MTDQDRIKIIEDPNRPGWRQRQAHLDRIIHENLDELNAIQEAGGRPPLEDPLAHPFDSC